MFNQNLFSERLLTLRKEKKLSQAQLAEQLGVSFHQVSKMEKGQRAASIEVLCALADYFDVPVDYLLGRGLFANWEIIMEYKPLVIDGLKELFQNETMSKILESCSDHDLMRILPGFIDSVEMENNKLRIYFFKPSNN